MKSGPIDIPLFAYLELISYLNTFARFFASVMGTCTGLDVGHPDFDYCQVYVTNGKSDDYRQRRCTGKAFLPEYEQEQGQDWYNPLVVHGTHVS
jgi:hypothetical protein